MTEGESITLKEVQLRLGVPQHVLIHLCEKGVIVPDFAETSGRGKRREFSERNVFEFAVALTLRGLELSVASTAFVIRLLRSFERATAKLVPGFVLPGSLTCQRIELSLHLYAERRLVFRATGKGLRAPLLLCVSLGDTAQTTVRPRFEKLAEMPAEYDAKLELDVTRIAHRIALPALLN